MRRTLNGVDLEAMESLLSDMAATPDLAEFQFSVRNHWTGGVTSRSEARDFYGCCQTVRRDRDIVLESDEPYPLLGRDSQATPAEHLLHALSACLTTSVVTQATRRSIQLHALNWRAVTELNLLAALGLDPSARDRQQNISLIAELHIDGSKAAHLNLLRHSLNGSPLYHLISRGIPTQVYLRGSEDDGPLIEILPDAAVATPPRWTTH